MRYNIGMSSGLVDDGQRDPFRDEPIEVGRYIAALRRNVTLIAAIVAVFTASVLVASQLAPETYDARADLIVIPSDSSFSGAADAESVRRQLATLRSLVTTPAVLQQAAQQLGVQVADLRERVTSSVDAQANILSITARARTAEDARDAANTVAQLFAQQREETERVRLSAVIDSLSLEISNIEAAGADGEGPRLQALEERRAQLLVAAAAAGSSLQIAREAELPDAPSSPHPLRNTVLALFGSLLLAVLVVLGRDWLRGRLTPRELSQVIDAPVLVTLPGAGRGAAASIGAAYRTLAALLRLTPSRSGPRRVLVTSALPGERRTTVVHALGIALAEAGERVLVVDADLRRLDLDTRLGVQRRPGLADLLAGATRETGEALTLEQVIVPLERPDECLPHVLGSGAQRGRDPTELLDPEAVQALLDSADELGYAYVLVDGPAATGNVPDFPVLASVCGAVLIVAELDHVTAADATILRQRLDQVTGDRIGLVVVDGGAAPPWPRRAGMRDESPPPSQRPVRAGRSVRRPERRDQRGDGRLDG